MLAWFPPAHAKMTVPLSDSHSLVRLLSSGNVPAIGDVVLRDASGTLSTQWERLWSRLDTWVNNSVPVPILVLDNVPYAFCAPGKCDTTGTGLYGMNYGPNNVPEYAAWIESLLHAMVGRYGKERASSFWFRVGTEPNTRPGHWNDTNTKYVEEYVAVADVVARTLPDAKVGLANMGLDEDGFDDEVMPMVQAIAASGARVDFLAMSCYGRGKGCNARRCRYSITTAALCASRLAKLRSLSPKWAHIPAQAMEYGLQQNELNLVDDDPGAFGAAWMLATSVAHATGAQIQRAFHWGLGFDHFSNDDGACAKNISPSPCSLYKGTAWVQAQAGHLFGGSDAGHAVVLRAAHAGSNASTTQGTSSDGLGGWSTDGAELRLLLTAFSPHKSDTDSVHVQVSFKVSKQWKSSGFTPLQFQMRSSILDSSTSVYNAIYREAKNEGWLANPSDPNVYRLSHMLTRDGKTKLIAQQGPAYLAMQRKMFGATSWQDTNRVKCDSVGNCKFSMEMAPPSVAAVWVRCVGSHTNVV